VIKIKIGNARYFENSVTFVSDYINLLILTPIKRVIKIGPAYIIKYESFCFSA